MNNLSWEEAFLLAQSYYELNGNLIVNNNYISFDGIHLTNEGNNKLKELIDNNLNK